MRDAQEERRVLDELELKHATRSSEVEVGAEGLRSRENLRIDPYPRR
jgi:hypothetical protein